MAQQQHRGPGPKDTQLFGAEQLPALRAAAADLCWLLDRGYAARSALELVGNRYDLTSRQRMAVARYACSRAELEQRRQREVAPAQVRGQELWLDGFNVLTVLESALAGGIVIPGRDGCCRDIAGIHRRYRKMQETAPALRLIGATLARWGVRRCRWWLDRPVSNSGRLRALILDVAAAEGWDMDVELSFCPDRVLADSPHVIATADGVVQERCQRWVNLTRHIIAECIPQAWVLDLSPRDERPETRAG